MKTTSRNNHYYNKNFKKYLFNNKVSYIREKFDEELVNLAAMAVPEKWTFDELHPLQLLRTYIYYTFAQCYTQKKLIISGNHACFNTGLLTPLGDEIYCYLKKDKRADENENNPNFKKWHFIKFINCTAREFASNFSSRPQLATYIESPEKAMFHPEYEIYVNKEHMVNDSDNWERVNEILGKVQHDVAQEIEQQKLISMRRAERDLNYVLYQYHNGKLAYLLPIELNGRDCKKHLFFLALELEKTKCYRANTLFTPDIAYAKARIVSQVNGNLFFR